MEKPTNLRVGFIGLGTMGLPMARNLAKAGFPLVVTTRHFEKAESFAKEIAGVRAAGTAAGAAAGAIVIDTSTIAAEAAQRIARNLADRGIAFLDAPVSGGQKGA